MSSSFETRFVWTVLAIVTLMAVGTLGYTYIEGWPIRDGFFMTVITFSTVGYGETHQLSNTGRTFTSAFIVLCLFTMAFWSATLTSCLVEGDLNGKFKERRTRRMISKLRDHAVVCGSGTIAEAVAGRLLRRKMDVVLIDADEQRLEQLKSKYRRLLTVVGDPTNELVLAKTNVLRASYVVAVLDSELDNLLVVITCKGLGTDVAVYAQSDNGSISNRMRKAGVDEVIAPGEICGERVVDSISKRPSPDRPTAAMNEVAHIR